MQRKRNTFIINQPIFSFAYEMSVVTTDQGLVYADNMSITPLLFYFAPQQLKIGSRL